MPCFQDEIDEGIVEIFTNSLVEEFIDSVNNDNWCWLICREDYYDYIREGIIEPVFNTGYNNILKEYNKSYTLDFKTSIKLLKFIKQELVDDYEGGDIFCDMFKGGVDSETKIINQYAYWWIKYIRLENGYYWVNEYYDDMKLIVKIFINIAKYNFNNNKHNKLINLYTKLDIKNKQKKTIIKILNNKFDTDILQNIICAY